VRALIVCNPRASRTHRRLPGRVRARLATLARVEIALTRARGDATALARIGVGDGFDTVVALGGDGTVNEIVQALVGTDVRLAVVPAGSANVLARSIGLPNDPVRALARLVDDLRADRCGRIPLGRVNGRWFVCNAGFGLDAAIVRRVEAHAARKRALGQLAFVGAGAREWARRGRGTEVELVLGDGTRIGPLQVCVVANAAPYTYLGPRALRAHPDASFRTALDVLALPPMSTRRLLQVLARAFTDASHVGLPGVTYLHDLTAFRLDAHGPLPVVVDGDVVGEARSVQFGWRPAALRLVGAP
jgi:diacylglycerol kinase family enzyme